MCYLKGKVQLVLVGLFLSVSHFNLVAQELTVEQVLNEVSLDSLVLYVKQLSGAEAVEIQGQRDTIYSRHYEHDDNEKAFFFLKTQLGRMGYEVEVQQFSVSGKNIIGTKRGSKYSNQYFLIGAHYDSQPAVDIAPGANDNGSGVAAIIEAARVLKEVSLPYTVKFAFWDEEEIGLLGSRAFVRTIGSNEEQMLGYINLDMIAWDGNDDSMTEVHVTDVLQSLQLAEVILKCNADYQIGLNLKLVQPGGRLTDHASFWNAGLSAVGINEDYSGDDIYPYIHTTADTIGHFNLPYFLKNTQLSIVTLLELALGQSTVVDVIESNSMSNLVVYPNPFTTELFIDLKDEVGFIELITLFDDQGKVLLEKKNFNSSFMLLPFDLPIGIYFLTLKVGERRWMKKLIKN